MQLYPRAQLSRGETVWSMQAVREHGLSLPSDRTQAKQWLKTMLDRYSFSAETIRPAQLRGVLEVSHAREASSRVGRRIGRERWDWEAGDDVEYAG